MLPEIRRTKNGCVLTVEGLGLPNGCCSGEASNGEAGGCVFIAEGPPNGCCSGEAANRKAVGCMFTAEGPPNGCCTGEGVNGTHLPWPVVGCRVVVERLARWLRL